MQDITAMSSKRTGFTGKRVTAAFDEAKLGIFDRDFTSNQIIWSQRHQELWGYHAGEFHGNSADLTSRLHPEALWRIEADIALTCKKRIRQDFRFRVV